MSHELPKSLIGCPKSKKMRCGIAPEVPKIYNRVGMQRKHKNFTQRLCLCRFGFDYAPYPKQPYLHFKNTRVKKKE